MFCYCDWSGKNNYNSAENACSILYSIVYGIFNTTVSDVPKLYWNEIVVFLIGIQKNLSAWYVERTYIIEYIKLIGPILKFITSSPNFVQTVNLSFIVYIRSMFLILNLIYVVMLRTSEILSALRQDDPWLLVLWTLMIRN